MPAQHSPFDILSWHVDRVTGNVLTLDYQQQDAAAELEPGRWVWLAEVTPPGLTVMDEHYLWSLADPRCTCSDEYVGGPNHGCSEFDPGPDPCPVHDGVEEDDAIHSHTMPDGEMRELLELVTDGRPASFIPEPGCTGFVVEQPDEGTVTTIGPVTWLSKYGRVHASATVLLTTDIDATKSDVEVMAQGSRGQWTVYGD